MEGKKPLKSNFKENPDNLYDTEMRFKAIEGGETSHQTKMTSEERFGVPAYDESVVSDYIRNRVEPPTDMVGGRKIFKVEAIEQPKSDYEKDLKKLQTLTGSELDELLAEAETKSKEGKGLFSKGSLLNGYAIDRQTLESLQSVHHDDVRFELAANISEKLRYSDSPEYVDIDTIKRRIVGGFVYLEIPGFKSPIVKLYLGLKEVGNLVPKEDVEKIVKHLKDEGKLLPISSDFKVL